MHPFLPARWSVKSFREAILQEHGDPLPTLLFEAKTILMSQITKAEESALSSDGDNPTANVSPTAEETTPSSQVTDTNEREPTRVAEMEILDIHETDPDLLSSDDEETTKPRNTISLEDTIAKLIGKYNH